MVSMQSGKEKKKQETGIIHYITLGRKDKVFTMNRYTWVIHIATQLSMLDMRRRAISLLVKHVVRPEEPRAKSSVLLHIGMLYLVQTVKMLKFRLKRLLIRLTEKKKTILLVFFFFYT